MNKKVYALIIPALLMLAISGCAGKTDKEVSGLPLDIGEVVDTPVNNEAGTSDIAAEETTPTPSVVNEKINQKMVLDTEYTVNGYSVTIKEVEKDDNILLTATVDGELYGLADGEFVKAYLCGKETGVTYMVVCTMNEEIRNTCIFRLDRTKTKLLKKTDTISGMLTGLVDNKIKITRTVDLMGTWIATQSFEINEKYKVTLTEPYLWEVRSDPTRYMTVLCDIRAREYESGKNTAILAGSIVDMVFIDNDFDFAVLKDVATEKLYKVYVESDGHGGFLVEDTGSEEGCFDNIRYSG